MFVVKAGQQSMKTPVKMAIKIFMTGNIFISWGDRAQFFRKSWEMSGIQKVTSPSRNSVIS